MGRLLLWSSREDREQEMEIFSWDYEAFHFYYVKLSLCGYIAPAALELGSLVLAT